MAIAHCSLVESTDLNCTCVPCSRPPATFSWLLKSHCIRLYASCSKRHGHNTDGLDGPEWNPLSLHFDLCFFRRIRSLLPWFSSTIVKIAAGPGPVMQTCLVCHYKGFNLVNDPLCCRSETRLPRPILEALDEEAPSCRRSLEVHASVKFGTFSASIMLESIHTHLRASLPPLQGFRSY